MYSSQKCRFISPVVIQIGRISNNFFLNSQKLLQSIYSYFGQPGSNGACIDVIKNASISSSFSNYKTFFSSFFDFPF